MRGSLLPARAMRVRAYICVRTYGGNAYARSNEKRKCIHRTKKNCIHVEGDSRASTPLPLYSIGRLIFYSGRSRICICSGVPFLSTLLLLHLSPSFSRDVCICLGHNTDDAAIGRAKSACISIQHACFNFDSRKPVFIFVYDLISALLVKLFIKYNLSE